MTIDGLTLYTVIKELKQQIIGAKVDKVFQPVRDEIILSLRTKTNPVKLLISASASNGRLGITYHPKSNPLQPPTFCMFLRKHLQSAIITDIEQVELERICNIHLDGKDELGIAKKMTLICELMGKYSNIILVSEQGKILQSMRHVPFGMSSVRQVLPGLQYECPPSDKFNPFLVSAQTFLEIIQPIQNQPMDRFLVQKFQGVSSATAHELTTRYLDDNFSHLSRGDKLRFIERCLEFLNNVKTLNLDYNIQVDKDGQPKFFSVVPYQTCIYKESHTFKSANEMLDTFYDQQTTFDTFKRQKNTLEKTVKKALDKLIKKFKIQDEYMQSSSKADEYKHNGDIVMSNIYQLKRGMQKAALQDFTTGEIIEIALDKRLSPSANAQKFYKRYNKLKKGIEIHSKNIVNTKNEMDFLQSVQVSLDASETMQELSEIKYELIKAGYISQEQGAKQAKPTQDASRPNEFISSDGIVILAGKNNRQNDLLTIKTAKQEDLWLHTQKIPGCHVIIKTEGNEIKDQTIFEAATIAAYYSKAKNSSKVAVDYTLRKNIRKPNGSKPGFVIYETYQTLIVEPDEKLVEKLFNK